jgi:hypothetical protein
MAATDECGIQLEGAQCAAFWERGFLQIPRLTTARELADLAAVFDRLFASEAVRRGDQWVELAPSADGANPAPLSQVLWPEKIAPELQDTLFYRNARQAAARLLGVPPALVYAGGSMILKPPLAGPETAWHQDEAFWSSHWWHHGLSVWLPLEDATVESGCLQFIPGSHARPRCPHHRLGHDPKQHSLVAEGFDSTAAVPCPVPAGGASIHHCRTLHYAGPNRTGRPRRACIWALAAPMPPTWIARRLREDTTAAGPGKALARAAVTLARGSLACAGSAARGVQRLRKR